ncbi:MAG: formylglycine-generating enzyme family protein [Victivallales bacterium]|nr:formylglycine-generating enzyme family protein [Victivallales bacterium]
MNTSREKKTLHMASNPQKERERLLRSSRLNPVPETPKWRFGKMRYALWAIQAGLVLAILEMFVIRPHFRKNQWNEALAAQQQTDPVRLGTPIEPLGEKAVKLPGLSEVTDALLAPVENLAQGSSVMRDAQRSVAQETHFPVEVQNTIGMRFRLVPAGTCLIGSPETEAGRASVENPHVVVFPSHFYMGKFEVTQSQWEAVMGAEKNLSGFRGKDRPVEEVSWYDCQRFCLRLCEMENLPIGTYRLPTEAEWEYCCRAGTLTAYYFGDNPSLLAKFADYAGNNYTRTVNVGQKPSNALGLFDMLGNVWEWCLDDYANYPGDNSPKGEHNKYPCIRGGNWYVDAPLCRSANRSRLPGASQGNMLGFRVLRQIVSPPKVGH